MPHYLIRKVAEIADMLPVINASPLVGVLYYKWSAINVLVLTGGWEISNTGVKVHFFELAALESRL